MASVCLFKLTDTSDELHWHIVWSCLVMYGNHSSARSIPAAWYPIWWLTSTWLLMTAWAPLLGDVASEVKYLSSRTTKEHGVACAVRQASTHRNSTAFKPRQWDTFKLMDTAAFSLQFGQVSWHLNISKHLLLSALNITAHLLTGRIIVAWNALRRESYYNFLWPNVYHKTDDMTSRTCFAFISGGGGTAPIQLVENYWRGIRSFGARDFPQAWSAL